jgi:ubiquitin conjugation factor E4 B
LGSAGATSPTNSPTTSVAEQESSPKKPLIPKKPLVNIESAAPPRSAKKSSIVSASPSTSTTSLNASTPIVTGTTTKRNPLKEFVEVPNSEWENRILSMILKVTLHGSQQGKTYVEELAAELLSEHQSLDLSFENIERVLYARISLPANSDVQHGHIFDYLVKSWIACQEQISKIQTWASNPTDSQAFMDFDSIAQHRIQGLNNLSNIILNYSGLVLNPDMVDCFPVPENLKGLGPAYLAHKILPPNIPEDLPRSFLNAFLERYKDDGLMDVSLVTVINCARALSWFTFP